MKEVTYGWYPAVNDVYRPKGRPSSHHLKCLYKPGDSRYYLSQAADVDLVVRGVASATPPASPPPQATPQQLRNCKSAPVLKLCPTPKLQIPTPFQCWTEHKPCPETQWNVVGDLTPFTLGSRPSEVNWPSPQGKQQQQQPQWQEQQKYLHQKHRERQLLRQHVHQENRANFSAKHLPRQQTHEFQAPSYKPLSPAVPDACDSAIIWPLARKSISYLGKFTNQSQEQGKTQKPRPASSPLRFTKQRQSLSQSRVQSATSSGSQNSSQIGDRIQSAAVQRHKAALPFQPVTDGSGGHSDEREGEVASPLTRAAKPFICDTYEKPCDPEKAKEEAGKPQEEEIYEKILEKYGWRAEVHGDPYRLKRPAKRLSYVVNCPEPELFPEPPTVYTMTNEPFFYNTIPTRPLSFAIHKEWMSEFLQAKRLEIQKRDGVHKYNYRNFAFVY